MKHLKPDREMYLMDVQRDTRPALTVGSGEVVVVEVSEAFVGVRDPSRFPTPFTDEAGSGRVTGVWQSCGDWLRVSSGSVEAMSIIDEGGAS